MGLHGHSSSDLPVHRGILQAGFKVLAHPTCHTLIDSRDHPNQCNRKDQICFCRLRVASRYIHTNPESAGKVSSCVSILLLLLPLHFQSEASQSLLLWWTCFKQTAQTGSQLRAPFKSKQALDLQKKKNTWIGGHVGRYGTYKRMHIAGQSLDACVKA